MYTRDGGESSRKHPPNSCWPIAFLGSPGTRTSARAASRRRPCRSRRRCPCRSRRRRRLRQRARRRRSRAGYSAAATTSAACGRELLDFTVETNAPTAIYAPESATGVLVPGDRLRIEGGLGARGPFPPLFLALGVSVAFQCANKVENLPANNGFFLAQGGLKVTEFSTGSARSPGAKSGSSPAAACLFFSL